MRRGLVDDTLRAKLLGEDAPESTPHVRPAVEARADAALSSASMFFSEMGTKYSRLVASIEKDEAPESGDDVRGPEGVEAGRALFPARRAEVVGAGLDALHELDEPARHDEERRFGALHVFWFIGAILVLAGSLMGVREAWRSLEGAVRPLVIASALFAYHIAFVGLARMLAKRSIVTGRVLGVIAVGLAPVAFIAAAVAAALSPALGIGFSALLLALSCLTLFGVSRIFGAGAGLATGLVPCLALEVLLGGFADQRLRLFVPLVALVPLAVAAARARLQAASAPAVGMAVAAFYGAVAVGLFALFGGPEAPALDVGSFGPPQLTFFAWVGFATTIAWAGASGGAIAERYERTSAVLRVVLLALALGAALSATVAVFAVGRTRLVDQGALAWLPAVLVATVAFALARSAQRHALAFHLAVPFALVAVFLGALVAEARPERSLAAMALVPAALFAGAIWAGRLRLGFVVWASLCSAFVLLVTRNAETVEPARLTTFVAAALAFAAHVGARTARPSQHYLGAILAFVAASVWLPAIDVPWILVGLSAAYGIAAFGDRISAELRPLDDVSLFTAIGCVYVTWSASVAVSGAAALPCLVSAVILAVRALRERSLVATFHSGLALAVAAHAQLAPVRNATLAWTNGLAALALVVPAALRREAEGPKFGRPLFGFVPLPLGAQGRALFDGYGLAAVVFALLTCVRSVGWLREGTWNYRDFVVFGLVAVLTATLAAFGTQALERLRARGNVVTLAIGGVVIALTAVSYRIGRPLPPPVVGWRLSIVIVGVWLFARLLVAKGPWVAERLERPAHGRLYHFVPHTGVGALALLLLFDAWLVGKPTLSRSLGIVPPMLLFGGGLGAFLLQRSSRWRPFWHVGLVAWFAMAWLVGAQQHVLGPDVALDVTAVLLWERASLGAACFTAASAALLVATTRAKIDDQLPGALLVWSGLSAVLVALQLAWQPALVPALVLLGAGALALGARASTARAITLAVAAPTFVHVLAQGSPLVPVWAGPAFALLALGSVAAGIAISRARGRDPKVLVLTQVLALGYGGVALLYANATLGATTTLGASDRVLDLAMSSLDGRYVATPSLGVALAVLGVAWTAAAFSWRGAIASLLAILSPPIFAGAGSAAAAAFVYTTPSDVWPRTLTKNGPLVAVAIALVGAAAHAVAIAAGRADVAHGQRDVSLAPAGREDIARGLRGGRDLVLVLASLVMALFVFLEAPGGMAVGSLGLAALATTTLVAAHAAAREGSSRHVYLVELLVVALYAFATRTLDLSPQLDAMLGLGYGFTLLGVGQIARRVHRDDVATATRRFLVVLPLLVAFLTADSALGWTSTLALGFSVLYAAVALSERSRIFGSLAALAANVALVILALAVGLDGIEIWLGPLGLLVAAIGQIFAPKMSRGARSAVRIAGGVLLYLPSGLKLALRLGAAEDATYSVVFGVVCLIGVVVGVALRVRAYLALGTLSFTLDLIANLVHAGLRDHRLGFVILSTSGLLILGVMITVTMRREQAWAFVARLRGRLRAWD